MYGSTAVRSSNLSYSRLVQHWGIVKNGSGGGSGNGECKITLCTDSNTASMNDFVKMWQEWKKLHFCKKACLEKLNIVHMWSNESKVLVMTNNDTWLFLRF